MSHMVQQQTPAGLHQWTDGKWQKIWTVCSVSGWNMKIRDAGWNMVTVSTSAPERGRTRWRYSAADLWPFRYKPHHKPLKLKSWTKSRKIKSVRNQHDVANNKSLYHLKYRKSQKHAELKKKNIQIQWRKLQKILSELILILVLFINYSWNYPKKTPEWGKCRINLSFNYCFLKKS